MYSLKETSQVEPDKDVLRVCYITEKVLRNVAYRTLEKIIEKESNEGLLDITTIPQGIIQELKETKQHLNDCELNHGNDVDKWIMHRAVFILETQVDETVKNFHHRFYNLTQSFNLHDEYSFAYDTFVRVCRRLFESEINWHRILALLCFGSEIAVYVIKHGKPGVEGFLKKVVHYIVEFTVKEEIAQWISSHGGWMTMIDFMDSNSCPERAHHILTMIAITELTHTEVWLKRITVAAVLTGVCITMKKILL